MTYTIGIDLSTDTVGVAIHDGEEFVSLMYFGTSLKAAEWTQRRMEENPGEYKAVMNNYNAEFTDLLITKCEITYGLTAGLPYNAITRAKHLAMSLTEKTA